MGPVLRSGIALCLATVIVGCALGPEPRLPAYLGPASLGAEGGPAPGETVPAGGVAVGLVVLNDTTAAGSAPALSPEVLDELARVLKNRLERDVPTIAITTVLRSVDLKPGGDGAQVAHLAQAHGLPYLLLAIFSSRESEVPTYLPLLGIHDGPVGQSVRPGYQTENFARVELALVNAKTGRAVLQADGQAYARLYRLSISLVPHAYPVVVRDQLSYPIFPQESNAYDVLRGVAGDDAVKQALMRFKAAWEERSPA